MASLAALITAAILKVSADPKYAETEFETREEARDNFTAALLYELGLGPNPSAEHASVSEPEKKKAAPKKRAAKTKTEEDADVLALTAAVAELAVEPTLKKAKKTKKEEVAPAPAPVSNAGAGVPPVAEKKKPGPKPKAAKAEGPLNLEKMTPTHKKHLKAIAEELKVEPRDKEFLAYANAMSAEEWSGSALNDHIRAFLMPVPPPLAAPPTEFLVVEFKGKEYLVDPATKFVYANSDDEDSVVRARDHVGVVGILDFAQMKLPA
jgi:hypothetical protein